MTHGRAAAQNFAFSPGKPVVLATASPRQVLIRPVEDDIAQGLGPCKRVLIPAFANPVAPGARIEKDAIALIPAMPQEFHAGRMRMAGHGIAVRGIIRGYLDLSLLGLLRLEI
jgi:hypothetical protein